MSDVFAAGAVEEARRCSIRVPEDLSVVGFDDIEDAGRQMPPLTTVRQPIEDKGRAAIDLIFEDRADMNGRNVVLPLELVVRASTAGPAG